LIAVIGRSGIRLVFLNDFHEYGVLWKPVMPT